MIAGDPPKLVTRLPDVPACLPRCTGEIGVLFYNPAGLSDRLVHVRNRDSVDSPRETPGTGLGSRSEVGRTVSSHFTVLRR